MALEKIAEMYFEDKEAGVFGAMLNVGKGLLNSGNAAMQTIGNFGANWAKAGGGTTLQKGLNFSKQIGRNMKMGFRYGNNKGKLLRGNMATAKGAGMLATGGLATYGAGHLMFGGNNNQNNQ